MMEILVNNQDYQLNKNQHVIKNNLDRNNKIDQLLFLSLFGTETQQEMSDTQLNNHFKKRSSFHTFNQQSFNLTSSATSLSIVDSNKSEINNNLNQSSPSKSSQLEISDIKYYPSFSSINKPSTLFNTQSNTSSQNINDLNNLNEIFNYNQIMPCQENNVSNLDSKIPSFSSSFQSQTDFSKEIHQENSNDIVSTDLQPEDYISSITNSTNQESLKPHDRNVTSSITNLDITSVETKATIHSSIPSESTSSKTRTILTSKYKTLNHKLSNKENYQEPNKKELRSRSGIDKKHSERSWNRERSRYSNKNYSETSFNLKNHRAKPSSTTTSRVFMAVFMAMSFFSSSPLSAGPTTKDQFENHNHISRTAEDLLNQNNQPPTFFNTFFSMNDTWSSIRTSVFVICLIQLLFPTIRSWFSYNLKFKKVIKKTRTMNDPRSSLNGNMSSHISSLTPGDQKCMQIYSILVKSMEADQIGRKTKTCIRPQQKLSTLGFYLTLAKEIARFISRHWLDYEILDDAELLSPQEQWVETCKWIKLNEVECLGGNPEVTRASMLYSCFHMLNKIEQLEDDENEYVEQSRSRVYATVAMQMALVVPHHGIAEKLSQYFWRLSMYGSGLEDDPLMSALVFDCHEDNGEDRIEGMFSSPAWYETVEVMNQQIEYFGQPGQEKKSGLSLSMTAPVLIPVGILSTLHLLDNLQTQFGRLIISITAKPLKDDLMLDESRFGETVFSQVMDITNTEDDRLGDFHRLPHWFATVGAIVDALRKSDIKTASRLLKPLIRKVPQSLVSRGAEDNVCYKNKMNMLDELTKKSMVHSLVGATLLRGLAEEQRRRGIEELWKAEHIRLEIKKLLNQSQKVEHDLESSVLALAEFVTATACLEAWIDAWKLTAVLAKSSKDCDVFESKVMEQVCSVSLSLRRMVRRHSLDGLRTNQTLVERLSRLCTYVSTQADDIESAFELEGPNSIREDHLIVLRAEKALEIFRGLS